MLSVTETEIESNILTREDAENLSFLLSTPQGTIPFARAAGMDFGILASPFEEMQNEYYLNTIDIVEDYNENLDVEEIEFAMVDAENGTAKAKVVITGVE